VKSGEAFDLNDFLMQVVQLTQIKKVSRLSGLTDKLPTRLAAKAGQGRHGPRRLRREAHARQASAQ